MLYFVLCSQYGALRNTGERTMLDSLPVLHKFPTGIIIFTEVAEGYT